MLEKDGRGERGGRKRGRERDVQNGSFIFHF
jgi:hypothetical protein